MNLKYKLLALLAMVLMISCSQAEEPSNGDIENPPTDPSDSTEVDTFYFGADLSYVNQILDKGGVFKKENNIENPYQIFADGGTNLVRLRLWHNPSWSEDLTGQQMYSDLADVERAIAEVKAKGMQVLLDFHYSDTWADPEHQKVPKAWENIEDLSVLSDSVYNYTLSTLTQLKSKNLLPDFVQLGNETNCGMVYTDAKEKFPNCNVCDGEWANLKTVLKSAKSAVDIINESSTADIKTILHVADPKNIDWWFGNMTSGSDAVDFDIIGISYYPLWHNTISLNEMENTIKNFRSKYNKEVMIVEIAYPWNKEGDDNYNNLFGYEDPIPGYPYTHEGHLAFMKDFVQQMVNAGAMGVIYWEPAWIAVPIETLWGAGSAWENCAFFDYDHNATSIFEYMSYEYEGLTK